MWKWARRIFVFLLLGAVVNVAVAWGCVVHANRVTGEVMWYANPREHETIAIESLRCSGYQQIRLLSPIESSINPLQQPTIHPFDSEAWWPADAGGISLRTGEIRTNAPRTRVWKPTDAGDYMLPARHFAAGWPWLALRASIWPDPVNAVTGRFATETRWGVDLDSDVFNTAWNLRAPLLLPLRPIWRGSACNILTYSTAIGVAWFGIHSLWRGTRTRRGQCPACGYPRGTSPVCTECGEALPC